MRQRGQGGKQRSDSGGGGAGGAGELFEVVNDIQKQGTRILLVEQNASGVHALANRGYMMESGEVTMSGEAEGLLADPRVRAAHLGE